MFKPLLSASCNEKNLDKLCYPLFVSYKLDGIRAIVRDGEIVSRNLKPIQNKFTHNLFSSLQLEGFDGELIVGSPSDPEVFRNTSSGVMSEDGEPDVTFYVFDYAHDDYKNDGFGERFLLLSSYVREAKHPRVKLLGHAIVNNLEELVAFEQQALAEGYEGIMMRNQRGKYKNGRSTMNEQILMKLKRHLDENGNKLDVIREEATIVGYIERMKNNNEATINALGHTERSSHKENMVGRGDLGSLVVKMIDGNFKDVEVKVGTGFNDAEREEIWNNQDKYLGEIVTVEYTPYGNYEKPRFPSFKGFRNAADMGE